MIFVKGEIVMEKEPDCQKINKPLTDAQHFRLDISAQYHSNNRETVQLHVPVLCQETVDRVVPTPADPGPFKEFLNRQTRHIAYDVTLVARRPEIDRWSDKTVLVRRERLTRV